MPVSRPASLLDRWRVRFLDESGEIARAGQWNDPTKPKLWLYNLHYFDELAADADAGRRQMQRELVARWIAENPPGAGNGWEPYPLSLRIANWIKWALSGEDLAPAWRDSLALQTRWLAKRLEWHLLGNHLLANAKALVLAGLYFSGAEAESWLDLGLSIYRRELPEQILADGAHFELSPMYHAIILEDLLDLANASRDGRADRPVFATLPAVISRMREWLAAMTHPDGGPAFFNDAAFAIAPSAAELEAYAARLGIPAVATLGEGVHHLASSGYVRIERGDVVAILDLAAVGPGYIPGHAHADTLSFELSLGAERIVVNSGTSTYAAGPLRTWQRSTAAHSTVEIDGASSSEVWASFRVARRARVAGIQVESSGGGTIVSACHDGYERLPGRPTHRRTWRLEDRTLTILDEISSRAAHECCARFHLAPGVVASSGQDGLAGMLTTARGRSLAWRTSAPARIDVGKYYPEFGRELPNSSLVVPFRTGTLTTSFAIA